MSPLHSRDQRDVVIAVVTLAVMALAGLWFAGRSLGIGPFECIGWAFDRKGWLSAPRSGNYDSRLDQAEQVADCDYLRDMTRPEVRANLGEPIARESNQREWRYFVDEINDTLGPGDAAYLFVGFDDDGRVDFARGP